MFLGPPSGISQARPVTRAIRKERDPGGKILSYFIPPVAGVLPTSTSGIWIKGVEWSVPSYCYLYQSTWNCTLSLAWAVAVTGDA